MSNQLNFLLNQAIICIQGGNLSSAGLLLGQIVKRKPNHAEALRLLAVILSQQGNNALALERIKESIHADKKNGVSYSNLGNIQLNLGMVQDAVTSYKKAIALMPSYSEAYSNLANAQQELLEYDDALKNYEEAIYRDGGNPDFYCNLGNCFRAMGRFFESSTSYIQAIRLNINHADARYFLGQLLLSQLSFEEGWRHCEGRWLSRDFNSKELITSKPRWAGGELSGRLFIWAEQGIGDQILYASMLKDIAKYASSLVISVDKKLVPIFKRSFPEYDVISREENLPESEYDAHIPIGSIGQYCRNSIESFKISAYLVPNLDLVQELRDSIKISRKILCGISWKSKNQTVGSKKSIPLHDMSPILALHDHLEFINLQYGDTEEERLLIRDDFGVDILNLQQIDLYDDLDAVLALIENCEIIVTTSNSIAHLAGAIGKETLLLVPFSAGKFWYWHDIDNVSLWYSSVKIFKQEKQGEWSKPIERVKIYLENKFAI